MMASPLLAAKRAAINSFMAFTTGEGMPAWPLNVFLEISNLCDLKCVMCPTFSAINPRRLLAIKEAERGFLDTEEAGRSLETILEHTLSVHCFGYGEATIHPRFREAIAYLSRFEVMVDFFTNGMHLDESLAEFLVSSRVFRVTVSFSGATKAEYESVYMGGEFDKVLAGMRALADAKARAGSAYPLIEVNSLGFQHHIERLEDFVDLMKANGVDRVYVKPLEEYGETINALAGHAVIVRPEIEGRIIERAQARAKQVGLHLDIYQLETAATDADYAAAQARHRATVEQSGKSYRFVALNEFGEVARSVVPLRPRSEWDAQPRLTLGHDDVDYLRLALDMEPFGTDGNRFHCMEPFTTMYVRRSGDVKPCCFADNTGASLGVVGRDGGEDIWRGNGFESIREGILSGLYPMSLCQGCLRNQSGPRYHFADWQVGDYLAWHRAAYGSEGLEPIELPDNTGIVDRIRHNNPAMLTDNRFHGGITVLDGDQGRIQELIVANHRAKLDTLQATLSNSTGKVIVQIEGNLDLVTHDSVEGWVWAPRLPEHRFEVSAWLGDQFLANGNAVTYRGDLEAAGKGDGKYHYKLYISQPLPPTTDLYAVIVRVEGTDAVLRRSANCH
jgi:MoaA/NifB/PqqE/SkfB family radical SAM enzyme